MKLSICMMVKNESKYLEQCLRALQPLRDAVTSELIIVDTGSEDNTVEIAKRYTDRVYFHKWTDNFSEMRNLTISYATGEWVFIIDGDEVLEDTRGLVECLKKKHISSKIGVFAITSKNVTNLDDLTQYSEMITPRLFRRDGYFHYEGAIHNQPVFKGQAVAVQASQIHYGYLANDKEMMERKFERTSRLLKKELEKNPNNLYYWYQLSVSYAMHGDDLDALRIIEKGYDIFCSLGKPTNAIFVLTHLAQMYQTMRLYPQVEKVCLEVIQLRDQYLDVYYFLAEAEVMQQKLEPAIQHYQKYFSMIQHWNEQTERDPSVMNYTMGNQEVAYFNLAQSYRSLERYEEALRVAEKIGDERIQKDIFDTITFLALKLRKYRQLRLYYEERVPENLREEFLTRLEANRLNFSSAVQQELAATFADLENEYGLLQRIIQECESGIWSEKTVEGLQKVNFVALPESCRDLFYYLIRGKYPLATLLPSFREEWFDVPLNAATKRHEDFCSYLYDYLEKWQPENRQKEQKLDKMLCRTVLLTNQLSDEQYKKIFERYIVSGRKYLSFVYNPKILADVSIYELKNDEEIFLLYLCLAEEAEATQLEQCVAYLRQALAIYPALKNGVQGKLYELKQKVDRQKQQEKQQAEQYKNQVKETLRNLVENHQIDAARQAIEEYKKIVPDDLDILLIESKLLLNEMRQSATLQE